jgi:hypothetical protein
MTTSESTENIMKAIMVVQQGAEYLKKDAKGQVGTREYGYTNLSGTWYAIKALMQQNDLVVVQSPTSGENHVGQFFQTTLYHTKTGEWVKEIMQMVVQREDPQAIGAAITYYRRYMLTSILGLIPDDDNDAKAHRLATAQQKAQWVGAVKQIFPDVTTHQQVIETIQNIVGKHPSRVREDEAREALESIKAFATTDGNSDE